MPERTEASPESVEHQALLGKLRASYRGADSVIRDAQRWEVRWSLRRVQ